MSAIRGSGIAGRRAPAPGLILHDYFADADGGGRLCRILCDGLGLDLAAGFILPGHPYFPHGGEGVDLGWRSDLPLWRQLKLAIGFQYRIHHLVAPHPWVIYSGAYAPLAVSAFQGRRNVLYCHTPPRFVYDQRDYYRNPLPWWQRALLDAFVSYLQPRYEDAIRQMDLIVTNSENVRQRIQAYLGRDALVVHPPCETDRFRWLGQEAYYLSTARLDGAKRVDVIIRAFLRMPERKLVVTSDGPMASELRHLAGNAANIHFTGPVNDADLAGWIGHAVATIYIPRNEDFGMSPVESMAAGKPVISVAEGGPLETILPGVTGVFAPAELEPEHLVSLVQSMTPGRALEMRTACEERAGQFSSHRFLERMRTLLAQG